MCAFAAIVPRAAQRTARALLIFELYFVRRPFLPHRALSLSPTPPFLSPSYMADADVEKRSTKESVVGVISNSSATAVNDVPSRTPSVADADAFPDGGAAAWLTVLGAFLALFCSFGQLNSFGTFQTWYAEHQLSHLPPSTIAWIGSLQLWVFFFSVSVTRGRPSAMLANAPSGWLRRTVI